MGLTVNVTTMADLEDPHLVSLVVNPEKDTILADPDSPPFLETPAEQFDTGRPWVF